MYILIVSFEWVERGFKLFRVVVCCFAKEMKLAFLRATLLRVRVTVKYVSTYRLLDYLLNPLVP